MHRIRELREAKGLTQVRLAVSADMNPATLNRIEMGKANPNLKTLERLADALGITVSRLLEDDSPKGLEPPLPFEEQGDEQRRYLRAWRSFLWTLALEWGEFPPQTSREIKPLLTAVAALVDAGVFEDSNAVDTSTRGELSLFRSALAKLYAIANDVKREDVADELRASLALVPNLRDRHVA